MAFNVRRRVQTGRRYAVVILHSPLGGNSIRAVPPCRHEAARDRSPVGKPPVVIRVELTTPLSACCESDNSGFPPADSITTMLVDQMTLIVPLPLLNNGAPSARTLAHA